MNDSDRLRYEMQVRVHQFGLDNAADFPPPGIGNTTFTELGVIITQIEAQSTDQQAGFGEAKQQYEIKDTAREDLGDQMSVISRTAKSMEYAIDGIGDKFKFTRNMPDESLLAKGRAFFEEATPYAAEFEAYGLPNKFLDDLEEACIAFDATFSSTASAIAEHVEATAQSAANVREGMIKVRVLDAVVRNKYHNNPGKLAAWTSASHVEKPPKKKKPTPP